MSADGFLELAPAAASRRREPLHRRTFQKVRRDSRLTGNERPRKISRSEASSMIFLVDRLAPITQLEGKRAGSRDCLCGRDVALYRLLTNMAARLEGMVMPSLRWLADQITGFPGRTKQVVASLQRLKRFGLIEWDRRLGLVDGASGVRGPQVKQETNFYRVLDIPAALRQLVTRKKPARPAPDDHQARRDEQAATREAHASEERRDAAYAAAPPGLREAFAKWARRFE